MFRLPRSQGQKIISLVLLFLLGNWVVSFSADQGSKSLTVDTLELGGFRAFSTFQVAADASTVQSVITDYEQWPELFDTDLRITKVERLEGRVVTELFVSHLLVPGEKRLLCENRELPGGGLQTTRLDGDFSRYTRRWTVFPEHDGRSVQVKFELDMDVDTWAPDWMVAVALRDELEMHFQLVRQRAEEIAAEKFGKKLGKTLERKSELQ